MTLKFVWPPVAVLLITWDRPEEIRQTLRAMTEFMTYPEPIALHIADDNSEAVCKDYLKNLVPWAKSLPWPGPVTFTVTDRKGWGANVNAGIRYLRERKVKYVYQTEDDYVLTRPLDLRLGMLILMQNPKVGMVRYRGIQGHRVAAAMQEVKVPDMLSIRQARGNPGKIGYWRLIPKLSRELYVYSHGPHLKNIDRFHGDYGLYREGVALGATEECFAHEVKDRHKSHVAVLPDWALMHYDHIGKSRQHTDADLQTVKEQPKPQAPEPGKDQKI